MYIGECETHIFKCEKIESAKNTHKICDTTADLSDAKFLFTLICLVYRFGFDLRLCILIDT